LTGGVINAIAKVLGVPLPPDFDSSMVQMIVVFKKPANGGFGSPPILACMHSSQKLKCITLDSEN